MPYQSQAFHFVATFAQASTTHIFLIYKPLILLAFKFLNMYDFSLLLMVMSTYILLWGFFSPGSNLKLNLVLMTKEWEIEFNRVNYRDYSRGESTAPDRVSVSFQEASCFDPVIPATHHSRVTSTKQAN